MSLRRSILPPLGSSETLHWIGSLRPVLAKASRAPKIAAFTSRMSWAVSIMIRSAPPSTSPCACSAKTSTSRPKEMFPRVGAVEAGGEKACGRDGAGDEAALADGLAGDFRRLGVDLQRLLAEPPLVQLQPRALEGVGLEHLRARLQHRRV